ncbi:ABC transporter ATP-binding protein [Roseibium marinum]|uniref:Peptide/nickel transport system ATP-binding protein n=1 Tax=Roseibium marinum TaxID=281252 RepID=A0A2S3UQQ4_9HYPH|nr:ABC transporter ATP-binding protein [Roseibium marinum]POF30038.1 peptide/nickel transport system ATP-binding protein [Roseibium marinum]
MRTSDTVLTVSNLSLTFGRGKTALQALDNVSLSVKQGEILSLVGESGCGKSAAMMAILGLLPKRVAHISASDIRLGDMDLAGASQRALRKIRGNRIGMIFQDPMTSLNPVHTVGFQIGEVVRRHRGVSWKQARQQALRMLDLVRIPDPARRLASYPHELSGGMRQRVMIAMALVCEPELLIADEPTTALDVTVQAQIMALIDELRTDLGMSVVLITHDLGVVAAAADRVAVMYAGRIVEDGPVEAVFRRPSHGYTAGLMRSLPSDGQVHQGRLQEIPGSVPRLARAADHCAFAPRCAFAGSRCRREVPQPSDLGSGHSTRCFEHASVFAELAENSIVRAWR